MFSIASTGYSEFGMVYWRLSADEIEFTEGEFEELVAHLRTGGLFEFLDARRPALKDQLRTMFTKDMEFHGLDDRDLESRLERCLLDLAQRVGHGA